MEKETMKRVVLVVAVIAVVIAIFSISMVPKTPPPYDLNDQYFKITTNKDIYELGETINITVQNIHNQVLGVRRSGCKGMIFAGSEYTGNEWIDYPASCGFCSITTVVEYFEPNETRELQWDQVFLDVSDGRDCEKGIADAGWYRIAIPHFNIDYSANLDIVSYSPHFRII